MTITEFAESRNIDRNTVSIYIRRHKDQFSGHTKKKNQSVELDDIALALLDEKYPVPKPVVVMNGIPEEEHREALLKISQLQDHIIRLQEELRNQSVLIAQAEAKNILLEDREKQIEKLEKENERLNERNFWDYLFRKK